MPHQAIRDLKTCEITQWYGLVCLYRLTPICCAYQDDFFLNQSKKYPHFIFTFFFSTTVWLSDFIELNPGLAWCADISEIVIMKPFHSHWPEDMYSPPFLLCRQKDIFLHQVNDFPSRLIMWKTCVPWSPQIMFACMEQQLQFSSTSLHKQKYFYSKLCLDFTE